jgi:Ca2+-binding EF-hand superfamily protein
MLISILAANPAQAQCAGSSASSRRANATAQAEVRRLLRLMDEDANGAVSRDEFVEYMSHTFDSLDINCSEQLERNELSNAEFPFGKGTSAAAATDVRHLLRLMDTDEEAQARHCHAEEITSSKFAAGIRIARSVRVPGDPQRRSQEP